MTEPSNDARVRYFHERKFSLRPGEEPELARASGDSGYVAHLAACSGGSTGWDWSFRMVRVSQNWAFVSDGRVTLFVDEPGQYVPSDAKNGDAVALRLPRARENLYPHRFSLFGGQGGCVVGHGFTKYFLPVTYEAAPVLVEACSSKWADQLRFSLHVSNSPHDYERADAAIIDVGVQDEPGVLKLLEVFSRVAKNGITPRGIPFSAVDGPMGTTRAQAKDRGDLCDGYGWRISTEATKR